MAPAQPTIANYDDQTADQVTQRLRALSQADLAKLEAYERDGQARSTVLDAITSLREREPWSGYDDMEVEEVNAVLRERDGDAAGLVLEYERRHKARSTVIEYAERRRETPSGGSREKGAARPRSKTRATRSRQPSAGTGSTARSASRKGQSKSSSSSGSGAKTRGSSRNAKGASRSGSSRSSGTAARPKSSSASTGARGSAARSSSGSSRSSGTSARSKSSSASTGARRASRSSSGSSRARRSSAKRSRAKSPSRNGMLDTVKNAASKASGPAFAVGAGAAGVAAGIALKSRTRRKNVLGVPLPRTIGQPKLPRLGTRSVAKTVGKAGKQVGQTSKSVSKRAERFGDQAKQVVKTLS